MYSSYIAKSFPEQTGAVQHAYSQDDLKRICEMHENDFGDAYDMEKVIVPQPRPHHFYYHKDNGSNILAVAHLDTVMPHRERTANFMDTAAGPVIYSGALDDRLGAYIILELLPALGIQYDILLTVGEESGRSTAHHFEPEKDYNWMIEFDRGGTDVVMYQYEDEDTADLVRDARAVVGNGIFSDISYMEHLGIKGFNWGVGYQDYHGPKSHAFLDDTFSMVTKFVRFHEANAEKVLVHDNRPDSWLSDEYWEAQPTPRRCDEIFGKDHMHDDDECAEILREFAAEIEIEIATG